MEIVAPRLYVENHHVHSCILCKFLRLYIQQDEDTTLLGLSKMSCSRSNQPQCKNRKKSFIGKMFCEMLCENMRLWRYFVARFAKRSWQIGLTKYKIGRELKEIPENGLRQPKIAILLSRRCRKMVSCTTLKQKDDEDKHFFNAF